ncbi:hypothetical protein ACHAQH_005473 [Verticillium albo-atrum]
MSDGSAAALTKSATHRDLLSSTLKLQWVVNTPIGILNVVWFEDALVGHGGDVGIVSDLYLLVSSPREAADVLLVNRRYKDTNLKGVFDDDEVSSRGGIRLVPSHAVEDPEDEVGVVLVDAAVWAYDLRSAIQKSNADAPLPALNKLLSSLLTYWLQIPEDEYQDKILWSYSLTNAIYCGYNLQSSNHEVV